ncbi:MAG TPA: isocitrate lyase/phosphoenolpyruvate mutase family protein [Solirubrobacterales bacterium]|jgi:2-methylisocitrate lyase-like PEP mutase family enzyme|nr:isocitrate lyase/phosphoenolpyruvate mutase family protein [Solirubrobacterales bacterium]
MADLAAGCSTLRSLHVRGEPLLLPNAWDVASARAVEAAGFPVVATTSAGVAAALGHGDHEEAPGEEMLAAAARIAAGVAVPVTVDAEAGYGMDPEDLVAALREAGAAGCNLEDTDHGTGELRDAATHAEWLAAVREAAERQEYGLVINARIDVLVRAASTGREGSQAELVDEALGRARAYVDAADCVYPILLWEEDALARFVSEHPGPVNALRIPPSPSVPRLGELGVARVSWGGQLAHGSIEWLSRELDSLADG